MRELFTVLTRAVEGAPAIAIGASILWGILSIILSPCHLASIPLIVGFINGQGDITPKRAFWFSALFASGILVTIAVIGIVTSLMGRLMGDIGPWGNYLVAGIFIVIGLHLLGVIPLPFTSKAAQVDYKKKGLVAALVLGLVFGIALGPCTFAYMAPMLAVTFTVASTNFFYGIILLLCYGVGHCSVIVAAGTSTEIVQHYLKWDESSRMTVVARRICGLLVILAGVYLFWSTR